MGWGNSNKDSVDAPTFEDVFTPTSDLELSDGLKMGVFGRPKKGKSRFVCTTPFPRLIIDTESNIKMEMKRRPIEEQRQTFVAEVLKYAEIVDVTDKVNVLQHKKVDLVGSLQAAMDAVDVVTEYIKTHPDERGTVGIDSATDIWAWLGIWLDEKATIKRTQAGDMPRYEWGKANKKYAQFLQMILHSDWHVVMTFRAQEALSDKGASLGYNTARLQKDTDYFLDLMVEADTDGQKPYFKFAGDRYGNLVGNVDNDWDTLIKEIERQSGAVIK